MEKIDFRELGRQLTKVQAENDRLDHLKKRYVQHAKELVEMADELNDFINRLTVVAKKIDPVMGSVNRSSREDTKELLDEIYAKCKDGTHITSHKLGLLYPALSLNRIYYLLRQLEKLPNINKAKDGTSVRLFYHAPSKVVLSSITDSSKGLEVASGDD